MKVELTFLGTGTSQGVPVIACPCEICQSTDPKDKRLRTSVHIAVNGKSFVIDSGPDFRYQMIRAGIMNLDALIFTHEHRDHTAGLDDIRAYNYIEQKAIEVYATEHVQNNLKESFSYIFQSLTYPGIPQLNLHTIDKNVFEVEGVEITPIEVLHYKLPVLGFRIGNLAYITDANFISEQEMKKLEGLDVLVLNALRREKHISHFTLDEAVELAQKIGAKETYFTHISHQLGLHEEVEKELPENIYLAYDGLVVKC